MTIKINIADESPDSIARLVLQDALDTEYNYLKTKDSIETFVKLYKAPETQLVQNALDALSDGDYLDQKFENNGHPDNDAEDTEKVNTAYTILEKIKTEINKNFSVLGIENEEHRNSSNEYTYRGALNRIYLEILSDKDSLESHEYEIYKGESKEPYAIIQSLSPFKLIVNSTGQCNSTDVTFTQEHEFNKFDDLLEKLDYLIKENQNSSTHKINNIRILNSSLKLHDDYTAEDLMNKTFIEDLNVKIHNLALDTTLFYEKQFEDEICKPIKVEELFLLGNTEIIKNEEQEEKQHKKLHL